MSDDSKELSRVEDILSGEDYLPKKPMSRVEELLMDGAMVPKVDDTDNGKVLKVIDGEWQPGEDVSGDNLPPVSSLDNGKVLKVVSGEWNIGDDKSESSFVYISSSYPFSGSKVALPANINNVLIANYTSSPKVPTFLVTSNNIIFEPKEVDVSSGTTPSVHIRWGRMYSTFDSATREQDIYNDSLSYNTQNQTTEASYFKTKAIQTIPPVDIPDSGKVMQVGNGGTWQANYLPEVDGVPAVEQADVGKVLKATDVGEYDWGDIPDPLPAVTSVDNGKVLKVVEGAWTAGADEGGSEAVYKTLAEYQALTQQQKEDPTKIYFVKDTGTTVSETKTQDDGTVTASAVDSTHYAWYVFDAQGNNRYWSPYNASFSGSWFKYEFANKYTFTGMDIWLSTWDPRLVRVVIEASNDNNTWTNITQNEYYDIETVRSGWSTTGTKYSFVLNANTIFKYVRVTFSLSPASQTTQKETALYVQHCDIKAATDARPKIYYKNVLYTPDELPTVSTSDTGKALVVNSDGVWDKGDIPRTNSVQVPPVIYDNSKLMKIADMTGFPELEKVFVTSEEYAQLTTAQKQDLSKIYYVSPYKFYTLKDGEIIIRVNGTTYEWFFNGFILTESFYTIPSEYRQYTKNDPYEGSTAWSDNTSSTSLGIIEMGPSDYTERISAQDGNWAGNIILNTPIYGKVIIGNGDSQGNTYSDPYDVETPILIYYGGKQYTEYTTPSVYRELTQDEYDALPSSKNSDGIIYFING